MNSHDVGRGRGGVEAALGRVTARTVVAGIDSDRLYPVAESARLAAGIPTADPLVIIHSDHGHDGFLIEVDAVGGLVAGLLDDAPDRRVGGMTPQVLWLYGADAVGKSAVGWEAYEILARAAEAEAGEPGGLRRHGLPGLLRAGIRRTRPSWWRTTSRAVWAGLRRGWRPSCSSCPASWSPSRTGPGSSRRFPRRGSRFCRLTGTARHRPGADPAAPRGRGAHPGRRAVGRGPGRAGGLR